MTEKLLSTESSMTREEAADKMRDLADKIAEGRVELNTQTDSIELRPSERVDFEIEVEEEQDGDISIELEVEWSEKGKAGDIEIN
jgi:amphi-Trp domain-containing protein